MKPNNSNLEQLLVASKMSKKRLILNILDMNVLNLRMMKNFSFKYLIMLMKNAIFI